MRYVAMSLAVAGLAVVAVGQETPDPQDLGLTIPARSADGAAQEAPARSLSVHQAMRLREGLAKADEGIGWLVSAAEMFKQGGDPDAAAQMLELCKAVRGRMVSVGRDLEAHEASLTEGIAEMEEKRVRMLEEAAKLEDEIAKKRESLRMIKGAASSGSSEARPADEARLSQEPMDTEEAERQRDLRHAEEVRRFNERKGVEAAAP